MEWKVPYEAGTLEAVAKDEKGEVIKDTERMLVCSKNLQVRKRSCQQRQIENPSRQMEKTFLILL